MFTIKIQKMLGSLLLRNAHLCGLILIAAFAVGTHLVLDRLLAEEHGKSAVIDLLGEQRMLAERIKSISLQLVILESEDAVWRLEGSLANAIAVMRSGHEALVRGDDSRLLPGVAGYPVDEIYFGAEHELDRQVRTFLAAAQSFLLLDHQRRHSNHVYLEYMLGQAGEDLHRSQSLAAEVFTSSVEESIEQLRRILWLLLAALMFSIFFEWLVIYRPSMHRIWRRNLLLQRRAATDSLTGVSNRFGFMRSAQEILEHQSRSCQPVSLIMLDIDDFKILNDTYGHHVGDVALKVIARTVRNQLRPEDLFARIGGEEFAALLPNTSYESALEIAERLRLTIRMLSIHSDTDDIIHITASFGVTEIRLNENDIRSALKRADLRMYAAKRSGRDRIFGR